MRLTVLAAAALSLFILPSPTRADHFAFQLHLEELGAVTVLSSGSGQVAGPGGARLSFAPGLVLGACSGRPVVLYRVERKDCQRKISVPLAGGGWKVLYTLDGGKLYLGEGSWSSQALLRADGGKIYLGDSWSSSKEMYRLSGARLVRSRDGWAREVPVWSVTSGSLAAPAALFLAQGETVLAAYFQWEAGKSR